MPSRSFPARTIVTPLTSNNHCGHCRKHPETPGLSQYKRFIKKSADIHTYQRDAPGPRVRLRRMQYRPGLIEGFLARTSVDLTPFCNLRN